MFKFSVLTLTAAVLFSTTSFAGIVQPENYTYPFKNSYQATLTAAIDHPMTQPKWLTFTPRADRSNVPLLEGRNSVRFGVYAQSKKAPLVFVIPGIGGDAGSGTALMLAEQFHKAGFHAVTVPNPFSWNYVLSVSDSALPGLMSRDIQEYHQFLSSIKNQLQSKLKIEAQDYSVVGYSWGALISGYLHQYDQSYGVFNFKKVVMISPAMDIAYGVQSLDRLFAKREKLPESERNILMGRLVDTAAPYMKKKTHVSDLHAILTNVRLNEDQMQWVIGDSFRESVAAVIYTSQQVNDLGILKMKATTGRRTERLLECAEFTFSDYLGTFVYQNLPANLRGNSVMDVLHSQGLGGLLSTLKNDSRVYVIENRDDFIADQNSIDLLINNMPESRLYLYPYGGHVGNMWFEQNQKDLLTILTQ